MAASIYCAINYYFTHLYGMMPAHTVASIRSCISNTEISNSTISKESSGFEPWLDPLWEKRFSLFKTLQVQITLKVSSRLKMLLKSHAFHPALLVYDVSQEIEEIWFKDMEPSGITVECLLLRSKNMAENEDLSISTQEISQTTTEILTESIENQEKKDFSSLSRNTIIKQVLRTYTSLCAYDPYLNVNFFSYN